MQVGRIPPRGGLLLTFGPGISSFSDFMEALRGSGELRFPARRPRNPGLTQVGPFIAERDRFDQAYSALLPGPWHSNPAPLFPWLAPPQCGSSEASSCGGVPRPRESPEDAHDFDKRCGAGRRRGE